MTKCADSILRNAADAKARMDALVQLAGRSSLRYEPALLILTWGEETLEQVTDRVSHDHHSASQLACTTRKLMRGQLGIAELVDAFDRIGVLQITDSEDLDLSLAAVLRRTVPDVLVRTQVVIHLNGELKVKW